jgi:hypothetical protein
LLFPRRQKATGGRGFPFFLPHPSERRLIGLSNARAFPKTLYQGLSLRCLRGFSIFAKVRFVQGWRSYNQRPRTGQVYRRAHSRRALGKATPPHGRWGRVGAWGSPVQGEMRMMPPSPTATKRPFP